MTTERKRKAPEQQSAIAKLRRAREVPANFSHGEASPIQRPPANTQSRPVRNGTRKSKSEATGVQPVVQATELSVPEAEGSNPYSVLPYKQSWDGNRTYERVSGTQVRVELADGTGCVILGRCTLWVKHGIVSVFGATLRAGPQLRYLSAPNCAALPTVQANQGPAEIELGGDFRGNQIQLDNRDFYEPPEELRAPENDLPFFVLGLNLLSSPPMSKLQILNVQDEHLRPLQPKRGTAGILLCGPRSAGIATLARCFLNRAVTAQPGGKFTIFVDLDPTLPVLAPVGTIAVYIVSSPILGHRATRKDGSDIEVVRMHYVGPVGAALGPSSWQTACIVDLVTEAEGLRKQYPKSPLIVLAAESLKLGYGEYMDEEVFRRLNLTSITTIERTGHSSIDPALEHLARTYNISFHSVRSINENPHTSRQHQLKLQAYFEGPAQSVLGVDSRKLTYYGPDAQLLAVVLAEGTIPHKNLERVLPNMLAAVVIVDQETVNMVRHSIRHCQTSKVPILPSLCSLGVEPAHFECRALSLISDVVVHEGALRVRLPVQEMNVFPSLGVEARLVLVVQPPARDGKFTMPAAGLP